MNFYKKFFSALNKFLAHSVKFVNNFQISIPEIQNISVFKHIIPAQNREIFHPKPTQQPALHPVITVKYVSSSFLESVITKKKQLICIKFQLCGPVQIIYEVFSIQINRIFTVHAGFFQVKEHDPFIILYEFFFFIPIRTAILFASD